MKILKATLVFIILTFVACNNDHSTIDYSIEESQDLLQQKSNAEYTLQEVLNGISKWDNLRNNPDELLEQFENSNALKLDMSQFPIGSALHAYACILNGELKFAIISEVYDNAAYEDSLINYIKIVDLNYTDVTLLSDQTYENYTFPLPTQYIQALDAINRIEDWNSNFNTWISNNTFFYQGFNIPTYSLEAQSYSVYFGLKNNIENPSVKDADLIIDNNNGLFYDTVAGFPRPGRQGNYYLLELI